MKPATNLNLKKIPISSLFDALSDPVRVEIIRTLLNEEEISCGQCKSSVSKSTMSHHFKVLRDAGLIQRREEGKVHFLSLRFDVIELRLPGLLETLRRIAKPF